MEPFVIPVNQRDKRIGEQDRKRHTLLKPAKVSECHGDGPGKDAIDEIGGVTLGAGDRVADHKDRAEEQQTGHELKFDRTQAALPGAREQERNQRTGSEERERHLPTDCPAEEQVDQAGQ